MQKLIDVAKVLRSKNAGPFYVTMDIMFTDKETYEKIKNSNIITKDIVSKLYKVDKEKISIVYYDAAFSIKVTIPRRYPSGDPRDSDIYGCQQSAPLEDVPVNI